MIDLDPSFFLEKSLSQVFSRIQLHKKGSKDIAFDLIEKGMMVGILHVHIAGAF